jgi:glucuronokinase
MTSGISGSTDSERPAPGSAPAPASAPGRGSAPARAALAGNPSDGYHGAVLAVAIDGLCAQAVGRPASAPAVTPASELVSATVARLERELVPHPPSAAVEWSTSIPRGVGLGGSSAIVTAVIRALCALHTVSLPPDELAALALAVETDELGIAAGPQDRVAQAYGGLTFMDFAGGGARGHYEPLDPTLLPPLLVSWRVDTGKESGPVHADLRERFERGEATVRRALAEAANAARDARGALLAGDLARFCRCVDATFDARRRMMSLDPRHVEMIELTRAEGAAANYTGSGGAIVAACTDPVHRDALGERLASRGCMVAMLGNPGATTVPANPKV